MRRGQRSGTSEVTETLAAPSRESQEVSALWAQNERLRQTIALLDRLAATALGGADVDAVTRVLAEALGQDVVVLDATFSAISAHAGATGAQAISVANGELLGFDVNDPRIQTAFDTAAAEHLPLRLPNAPAATASGGYALAAIGVGEDTLGFLVVSRPTAPSGEDLDLLSVQYAASIYALALQQQQRDQQLRERYQRELVEALLLGRLAPQRAVELAGLAGLTPDVGYFVLALAATDDSRTAATVGTTLGAVARALDGMGAGVVAVPRSDHVAVLVPEGALADDEVALKDALSRRFPGVDFGIGASSVAGHPSDLGEADEQAQRALGVALRLGVVGKIATYDDLGIQRLLLHVPASELEAFATEILGALLDYDRDHSGALVATLAAYLRNGESLRQTAAELILHVNSVSYRIRRIETISGLRLGEPEQRLLARVALGILGVGITPVS